MLKLSGLQKDVLKLYRTCVRETYKKPVEFRSHWQKFARDEFEKHKAIPKKLFSVIEHLTRVGHKRIELYLNPQIKNVH